MKKFIFILILIFSILSIRYLNISKEKILKDLNILGEKIEELGRNIKNLELKKEKEFEIEKQKGSIEKEKKFEEVEQKNIIEEEKKESKTNQVVKLEEEKKEIPIDDIEKNLELKFLIDYSIEGELQIEACDLEKAIYLDIPDEEEEDTLLEVPFFTKEISLELKKSCKMIKFSLNGEEIGIVLVEEGKNLWKGKIIYDDSFILKGGWE